VAVAPVAGASLPTGGAASSCITYKKFKHDVDRRHPTTNSSPRMHPCTEDFTLPGSSNIMLRRRLCCVFQCPPPFPPPPSRAMSPLGVQPFRQQTTDSFGPNASKIKALHEVNIIVAYPEYAKRMKKNQESLTTWRRIMLVLESPATGHHYPQHVLGTGHRDLRHGPAASEAELDGIFLRISAPQAVWLADVVKVCQAILHCTIRNRVRLQELG